MKIYNACAAMALATVSLLTTASQAAVSLKIVQGSSCTSAVTTQAIAPGATGVFSVCALGDAAEFVCSATYPVITTNAAAGSAAVQITVRTLTAPFSEDYSSVALPATLTTTATGFSNGVVTSSSQPGVSSAASQKIAELTASVPGAAATGQSFTFGLAASREIATRNPATTNCNDLDLSAISNSPADAPFSITTPAGPPSVTLTASSIALTDSAAQVSTITIAASNSNPLSVALTLPAVSGRYTTTCTNPIAVTTSNTCTITATANTTPFDGNVTAAIALAAGTGYTVGSPSSANVVVSNDDLPVATLSPATANVNDSGASQTVTVTLSAAAPTGGFSVPITGPAASGRVSGTCAGATSITVAAGTTTGTCTIIGTANNVAGDGNVPAVVTLGCSTTCTNGAQTTSTVTVVDDDVPVISAVCTPTALVDAAANVSNCTLSSDKTIGATALSVTIAPPAVNAARYTLTTCTSPVSIPAGTAAGASIAACTITAVANTTVGDGNVTASLSVTAGSGYSVGGATQNVVVSDNDLATISVAVSPATVAENSGTALVYTFTSTPTSTGPLTVLFSLPANATRYTIGGATGCATGSVVLAANAPSFTCTVTPVNTTIADGNVTATATISASTGNYLVAATPANAATGTITDDEIRVTVTPLSVTEGGAVTFTVACIGPAGVSVTGLNFAVTPAQDVGAAAATPGMSGAVGTLTCGTPFVVTVPTVNDTTIGNGRSLSFALSGTAVASNQGSVTLPAAAAVATVADNDQPVAPTSIPTMSVFGLGLMSLMLFGFAAFQRRRYMK